jgi:hypothetical protein
MAFEFEIKELVCNESLDGLSDVIVTVHYYSVKDGVAIPGSLGLSAPHESAFIPFEEVTEEMVLGWLNNGLDLEEIETALDSEIAYKQEVIVSKPLPWL